VANSDRISSGESKKRASLRDVAARAGIGIASASAALNGSKSNTRVSEATRQKLAEIARELDYHPNAMARALTGQPTRTLGLLFGLERVTVGVANAFAFDVMRGIIATAAAERYNITLFTEPWHDSARSGGPWRDGRTDGVLLLAVTSDSDVIPTLTSMGVPLVAISSAYKDPAVLSVDVDNEAGANLATTLLIDLGHRRIAHLPGDENLTSAAIRRKEFLAVCRNAGVRVPEEYVPSGTFEQVSGYERTRALLALIEPPTSIFAASDIIAIGAIQAAHDCGVAVPEQLSVIGFDDAPYAEFSTPPLTTIRQPLAEIGAAASRLLIDQLQGIPTTENCILYPPELIVRGSTAVFKG